MKRDLPEVLYLYHGGRLQGPVEIRPQAKKNMQMGPAFYATDTRERAQRYAKGGGRVYKVAVKPPRYSDEVKVPFEELASWVKRTPGVRKKPQLLRDLEASRLRIGQLIPANYLVNLTVYHGAVGPSAGPALAEFLASVGAQASVERQAGSELWYAIYDPRIVLGYEPD